MSQSNPSVGQLKRAVEIAEHIEQLRSELAGILGQTSVSATVVAPVAAAAPIATPDAPAPKRRGRPPGKVKVKRTMSEEARAKIAEAQRKRWAKTQSVTSEAPARFTAVKKKKGTISPEGRERIAAAQRARWAKAAREKKA